MTKKIYAIVLVALASLCNIVSSKVSGLISDGDVALVPSSGVESIVPESGEPIRETLPYSGGNHFGILQKKPLNIISEYDPIIRKVASDRGYDWRFISAIAFAESRFDHDVVSHSGAVGLMQIMPVVARQFEVDPMHIGDPHTNITLGVEFLDYIGRTLRFPASTSEKDRLSIILASYNCGMGHVLDARRLAVKYGENPNSWNVVSRYLQLKCEPEYYDDEVVRCGAFYDNRQTLSFVKKVMRYYDSYCEIAVL